MADELKWTCHTLFNYFILFLEMLLKSLQDFHFDGKKHLGSLQALQKICWFGWVVRMSCVCTMPMSSWPPNSVLFNQCDHYVPCSSAIYLDPL